MTERIIQRCVFTTDLEVQPLYFRRNGAVAAASGPRGRFAFDLPPGMSLTTDTYFNSFFADYWLRYTRLKGLALRLNLAGAGTVRLLRRVPGRPEHELGRAGFDGDGAELALEVPRAVIDARPAGALHFEVRAAAGTAAHLRKAEWAALEVEEIPVKLAVGFCTFNREALVLESVARLIEDAALAGVIDQILIVDQGTARVRRHPAFRRLPPAAARVVRLVDQANFGGAGGFTRAILEARAAGRATHVLLMDDDSTLETESVFRLAAFLALARGEVAVGGPMLDRRRPLELYQAGALLQPRRLGTAARDAPRSLATPDSLAGFVEPAPAHYNSWWFFGFPLRLIDRAGLPLPLFIRGDDAEFGYRLRQQGVPTVTVPGLAVWHEPFYVKQGGWHPYYDLRNMLIVTAIHGPQPALRIAGIFLRRLVHCLLRLNYFQAAILCDALAAYCRGPTALEVHPEVIHQRLLGAAVERGPEALNPAGYTGPVTAVSAPASPLGKVARLAWCGLRQVLTAGARAGAPVERVIAEVDAGWWSLGAGDVVGVHDRHTGTLLVYRRCRKSCLDLLGRGLGLAFRLLYTNGSVSRGWRSAFRRLAGGAFWSRYLRLQPPRSAADVPDSQPARAA